jgi:hypothetical protein
MAGVEEFFRFCPGCGKRFHIKLVSKKLIDDRREVTEVKRGMMSPMPIAYGGSMSMMPLVVEENVPITVETEEFQFTYKCKHCGHQWTENRTIEQKTG